MRTPENVGRKKKPEWRSSTTLSAGDAETQGHGVDDNTIVVFTTDNGAENFTWPDGDKLRLRGKGTALEGGFRVPAMVRWPGHVRPAESRTESSLVWTVPTFVAAAGDPNIVDELKQGKQLAGQNYKVHSTATTSLT